jgi:hypothetical protein
MPSTPISIPIQPQKSRVYQRPTLKSHYQFNTNFALCTTTHHYNNGTIPPPPLQCVRAPMTTVTVTIHHHYLNGIPAPFYNNSTNPTPPKQCVPAPITTLTVPFQHDQYSVYHIPSIKSKYQSNTTNTMSKNAHHYNNSTITAPLVHCVWSPITTITLQIKHQQYSMYQRRSLQ